MARLPRRPGTDEGRKNRIAGMEHSNTEAHRFGQWQKSMKRTFALILAALAAAALFVGLVHAVLVAAHVSEPAATTVHGLTPRRLWATTAGGLALVGVVTGGLAVRRSGGRIGAGNGRPGAI